MHFRFAATALATALLCACATSPDPLRGDFTQLDPRDAAATDSTGAYVRWGGRIAGTEPRQGQTCFEVVSADLSDGGRPQWAGDDIGGRFIACRIGFFDPAVFESNRDVTFTGRLDGYENRRIAGHDYRFPRIAADVVHLWPQDHSGMITRPPPWPWWGWW